MAWQVHEQHSRKVIEIRMPQHCSAALLGIDPVCCGGVSRWLACISAYISVTQRVWWNVRRVTRVASEPAVQAQRRPVHSPL